MSADTLSRHIGVIASFTTKDKIIVYICDDCFSKHKKKYSRCGSDANLVFIHFSESGCLDRVSCKFCMYHVINSIEFMHDEVGDSVIDNYFSEFLLEDGVR